MSKLHTNPTSASIHYYGKGSGGTQADFAGSSITLGDVTITKDQLRQLLALLNT